MGISCPPELQSPDITSFQDFNVWKESLIDYLRQEEKFRLFLPQNLYSVWSPKSALPDPENSYRIQELHPSDPKTGMIEDDESSSYLSRVLAERNHALDELINLICGLCKHCDCRVIQNYSSSLQSIIEFIQHFYQLENKESNILKTSEIRFTNCDYTEFYTTFRNTICSNLKKKGDRIKLGDDTVLLEDEVVSVTFEDVIMLWCLERIHTSLPEQVNKSFGHQLKSCHSLQDMKEDIFKSIPILLQFCQTGEDRNSDQKVKNESFEKKSQNLLLDDEDFKITHDQEIQDDIDTETFYNDENLKDIIKQSKSPKARKKEVKVKKKETFQCKNCDEIFTKKRDFSKHVKICETKQSDNKDNLNTHNDQEPSADPNEKFVCPLCGKIMGTKNSLACHIRRHNDVQNSFACDICGKLFDHRASLRSHLIRHKNSLKCDNCGRTFVEKIRLDNHVCKHFSCVQCNIQFLKERNLKIHMMIHDGKTIYSCPECESLFDTKRKLNKHKNGTHKDEKKYKCDECPAAFKGSITLRTHKLRHKGEKPFKCEECNKSFFQKSNLESHKLVHSNEYPFSCNTCGLKFRCTSNVKYHVETTRCGLSPHPS